ncbi:hypothetical protein LG325_08630 [Marinobacter nauticus]
MSGRKLGPFLAVITFLPIAIMGTISKETDSMPLYYATTIMFILWGIGCVRLGDYFKTLWIGPTYEAMEKELEGLRCFLEYPASKRRVALDPELKKKQESRARKLEQKMREYRALKN